MLVIVEHASGLAEPERDSSPQAIWLTMVFVAATQISGPDCM